MIQLECQTKHFGDWASVLCCFGLDMDPRVGGYSPRPQSYSRGPGMPMPQQHQQTQGIPAGLDSARYNQLLDLLNQMPRMSFFTFIIKPPKFIFVAKTTSTTLQLPNPLISTLWMNSRCNYVEVSPACFPIQNAKLLPLARMGLNWIWPVTWHPRSCLRSHKCNPLLSLRVSRPPPFCTQNSYLSRNINQNQYQTQVVNEKT